MGKMCQWWWWWCEDNDDDDGGNGSGAALVSVLQMWEGVFFLWPVSACQNLSVWAVWDSGWTARCQSLRGRRCDWAPALALDESHYWPSFRVTDSGIMLGAPGGPAVGPMLNVWSCESMERWSVANIFVFPRRRRGMTGVTLNALSTWPRGQGWTWMQRAIDERQVNEFDSIIRLRGSVCGFHLLCGEGSDPVVRQTGDQ